jgi:DNA helicase II / ATP-dependent DNA helicase PcrA
MMAKRKEVAAQALDRSQQEFCNAPSGNIRLLAPAGCGKTHSILHRCRQLQATESKRKVKILLVTFTVAARDELKSRLDEFSSIRDQVEVTTLNAWGWRRVRTQSKNPRLLTNKIDQHFAVQNQLAPVFDKHKRIKSILDTKKPVPTHDLLELMDSFKSLGFDHTRMKQLADFATHIDLLAEMQLSWRVDEIVEKLRKLDVIDMSKSTVDEVKQLHKRVFDNFYKFWIDATDLLMKSATFTLEDQKYFAYLDEMQKYHEADRPLAGAAKYDHIIVDEFQDINPLDLNLLKAQPTLARQKRISFIRIRHSCS